MPATATRDPHDVPVLVFSGPAGADDEIVVHACAPERIVALAALRAQARWLAPRITETARRVGDGTTYFTGE